MSKLLLDTNAFLAMIDVGKYLPKKAHAAIKAQSLILSIATPWEMTIKNSLGKLQLQSPIEAIIAEHADIIMLLPIELKHLKALSALPHHYRDPFDRLIVAQALAENLPVVSSDAVFEEYGVKRIWE